MFQYISVRSKSKIQKPKILIFTENFLSPWKVTYVEKSSFFIFSQKYFGRTRFTIFPIILDQKTKIENFEFFPKFSKSGGGLVELYFTFFNLDRKIIFSIFLKKFFSKKYRIFCMSLSRRCCGKTPILYRVVLLVALRAGSLVVE